MPRRYGSYAPFQGTMTRNIRASGMPNPVKQLSSAQLYHCHPSCFSPTPPHGVKSSCVTST
eukprot:1632469-Prorocentrum_lima.AAC.1